MADDRRRAHARAARAVPLKLVIVTKGGGKAMDAACKEWSDKISRYTAFRETAVRTNPKTRNRRPRSSLAEGERVVKLLEPNDFVVLLDERGMI